MLETAIKFEKAFNRFKEDDPDFTKELKDGVPKKEDWANAQVLAMCLRRFYEATKRMSGSLYVTSNMHFHEIFAVLVSLLEWESSTNEDIRNMGSQMRGKFDKYYEDLGKNNLMMLVDVVLDPRYKFKFVKYSLGKIIPNDYAKVDEMSDHLYKVLKKLFDYYFASACASSSKNDAYDLRYFSVDNDGAKNDDLQNKEQLHKYYKEFDEENDQGMVDKNELEEYLEEQNVKRVEGESFDISAWWKEKSDKYKVLATMARDILAIPVSTVSSESAFSTSGRVLDQFRSSLGPKTVEALVCAQDWLRASEICIDIERVLEDVEKYEEELGDVGIRQVDDIMENI